MRSPQKTESAANGYRDKPPYGGGRSRSHDRRRHHEQPVADYVANGTEQSSPLALVMMGGGFGACEDQET